jgi:hypothetical protein
MPATIGRQHQCPLRLYVAGRLAQTTFTFPVRINQAKTNFENKSHANQVVHLLKNKFIVC